MKTLKIATAGSVDDGKSTLIGRLLYDTKSLPSDKLEAIELSSKKKGLPYLDFALATDGLVAEREQGITIDVAHIYFSSATKSYIIADAPGHIEYTRNMVTGASTSSVSIILIDARKGVVEQTFRHFFINDLLRTKKVIVAVNKMDLVDFSQVRFEEIKSDFEKLIAKSSYQQEDMSFVPISALKGDNVVISSHNTHWYSGGSIMEKLEALDQLEESVNAKARFPIQQVLRPKTQEFHDYRGYAGKLYGNSLKVGDTVTVLPSLIQSEISGIRFYEQEYDLAQKGSSIALELRDDVNLSRGDMLVKSSEIPRIEKKLRAKIAWMDSAPLMEGARFILQHGVNKVLAKVSRIEKIIKPDFSGSEEGRVELCLNEIALVDLQLSKPIYCDAYYENPENGAFILIHEITHQTAAVGFIQ